MKTSTTNTMNFSLFKQMAIVFFVLIMGEFLNRTIIHFIPGSVLGLLILLFALELKIIRVEMVVDFGSFLLKNLAFFFVVPGVSLLQYLPILSQNWWKIALVSIISTFIVMIVTGFTLQLFLNRYDK